MNSDREVTNIVRSWLEDGVTSLPDRVLDDVIRQLPRTTQRRSWWPPRRIQPMTFSLKALAGIAAVVVALVIGFSILPGLGSRIGGTTPTATASPTSTPTAASASPSASAEATLTAVNGARISVVLPTGWTEEGGGWAILKTKPSPLAGTAVMFASVENMFSDPCFDGDGPGTLMDPPLGPTVDDLATGLSRIPGTTASEPVSGTIAGLPAKVVDFTIPADNPCGTTRFYLWEDDPGGYTYAQGVDEVSRTWVFEIDGKRVLLRTLTWGGTSEAAEAELQSIVDTVRILPATAAASAPLPEATLTASNGARISVQLPAGWTEEGGWALLKSDPSPLAGMGLMFASPENMFSEPCLGARKLMDPPLGPTVDDLVTGLSQIPGTTAAEPVSGTVAGLPARVVDFTIPADSRCGNVRFYLWEDDPGGFTWAQGNDEVSRTRVFEIDGQRVLLRTLTWRGTTPEAEAELQAIVDSVRILPVSGD